MQTTTHSSTNSQATLPEDPIFRRLKILQLARGIKRHGDVHDLCYQYGSSDCYGYEYDEFPRFHISSGPIQIDGVENDLFGFCDFSGYFGAEKLTRGESKILAKAISGRVLETDLKEADISKLSISSRHEYLNRVVRGVGKLRREEQMDISYDCTGSGVRIRSFHIKKGDGEGYALPEIDIRRIGSIYDTYDGTLNGNKLSFIECDIIVKALKRSMSGIFWTPLED